MLERARFAGSDTDPVAIVDIGSNSVRLVVYEGGKRSPLPLYNEKGTCELGRGVARNGVIDEESITTTVRLLQRFRVLTNHMHVGALIVVATAAIRDADNGASVLAAAEEAIDNPIQLLSGPDEAAYAAAGILSGIPNADGVVGDLGGGSLELVDVAAGCAGPGSSVPIGTLRLLDGAGSMEEAAQVADAALEGLDIVEALKGRTFYAVGGTWRALARIHMEHRHYPLHMIDHYSIRSRDALETARLVRGLSARSIREIPNVSSSRIKTIPYGALVLERLIVRGQPERVQFSAHGVRDGVIYSELPPEIASRDPLIASALELAQARARSVDLADEQFDWMTPLFENGANGESDQHRRVRHAACLVADIAWRAHPDYRGLRCIDIIAHGGLAGVSHTERASIALAVYFRHESKIRGQLAEILASLLDEESLKRARKIGAAMRLATALGGGRAGILRRCVLQVDETSLSLTLSGDLAALSGPRVSKRLAVIGNIDGHDTRIEIAV